MPSPPHDIPLSIQIYEAHHEWNVKEREFDAIDSQMEVLRARKVLEYAVEGCSVTRAENTMKASEWNEEYQRGWVVAKYEKAEAKAKHAYLVNLAQEQRDEGFNERFAAKL